jgi:hypothetical protein
MWMAILDVLHIAGEQFLLKSWFTLPPLVVSAHNWNEEDCFTIDWLLGRFIGRCSSGNVFPCCVKLVNRWRDDAEPILVENLLAPVVELGTRHVGKTLSRCTVTIDDYYR